MYVCMYVCQSTSLEVPLTLPAALVALLAVGAPSLFKKSAVLSLGHLHSPDGVETQCDKVAAKRTWRCVNTCAL